MHDFVTHVLRRYFEATGWNPHNSYLDLTSSSSTILDFSIPTGLSLSFSASPSPPFFATYSLRALPTLRGAVGYVFASTDPEGPPVDIGTSSAQVRFKNVVDRFRVFETPRRPTGKDEIWQGGKRVDTRDYLLYGCIHVPTSRLDALYTCRLSPTWQLLMTAVSMPPRQPTAPSSDKNDVPTTSNAPLAGPTNFQALLQNDTGRWYTEYSYSADDALWGFRVLHNFGAPSTTMPPQSELEISQSASNVGVETSVHAKRPVDESGDVDEKEGAGGGLRGRFSAGAELFFSAAEKSAGLSTGVRFSTLPDPPAEQSSSQPSESSNTPSQPPTTITATLNPMMGHLSTAYAARMSRDVVVSSRFDFNVYSYDSEFTFGTEYWLRSPLLAASSDSLAVSSASAVTSPPIPNTRGRTRSRTFSQPAASLRDNKYVASMATSKTTAELSLRESTPSSPLGRVVPLNDTQQASTAAVSLRPDSPTGTVTPELPKPSMIPAPLASDSPSTSSPQPVAGVLKARLSSTAEVSLLCEGRLRNCLVSAGIRADLASRTQPIKGVGLEIVYFSSAS